MKSIFTLEVEHYRISNHFPPVDVRLSSCMLLVQDEIATRAWGLLFNKNTLRWYSGGTRRKEMKPEPYMHGEGVFERLGDREGHSFLRSETVASCIACEAASELMSGRQQLRLPTPRK